MNEDDRNPGMTPNARSMDPREELIARVDRDFTLHPPSSKRVGAEMDAMRAQFRLLALRVADDLPICREQSLAITKLEEACFYAIATLARNQ